MLEYLYCCLILPVAIVAELCADPGISFKFVCKGDAVVLFQDVASIRWKTDITLYKTFKDRADTIASGYFRNSSYEVTILDKYNQKVSITNETVLLHDFQASDEAQYVMLYQNASKRMEVQICELVPPTLRCRPDIVKEDNFLIASLNNPDYCGKPVVSISWMDSQNITYSSHEIIKLPFEDQSGTYKACIVGEAMQCLNESSKMDRCKTFIPEYTNKNRTNCFSPDDFIYICKSVADMPRLVKKTEATVWIVSFILLLLIIVFVMILILILSGKLPKTCARRKENRRTDDVSSPVQEEAIELQPTEHT